MTMTLDRPAPALPMPPPDGPTQLDRYLLRLAAAGTWLPIAAFLDTVRSLLDLPALGSTLDPAEAALDTWRSARPSVLDALARLDVRATVARLDQTLDLAAAEVDLAGLVRVHRGQEPAQHRPRPQGSKVQAYRRLVAERYELTPTDQLPTDLRGIVGQLGPRGAHDIRTEFVETCVPRGTRLSPQLCSARWVMGTSGPYTNCTPCGRQTVKCPGRVVEGHETQIVARTVDYTPAWMDHAFAWFDRDGLPTLTCEPYAIEPEVMVRDVEALGLMLDPGPQPGVWSTGSTLLIWRWAPDAVVPPAVHVARVWSDAMNEWIDCP